MAATAQYEPLRTEEGEMRPHPPKQPVRYVIVILIGLLALFFVTTSFRTTSQSQWSKGGATKTLFGRYEKLKLQTENAALKEQLAQLQLQLQQRQNEAMLKAASASGTVYTTPEPIGDVVMSSPMHSQRLYP